MSPDVLAMVIALFAFAFAVTVLGGVAGMLAHQSKALVARFDERFDGIDKRFVGVDARFEQIDARFDRVEDRLERLETDLVDVKIAIARLEGPTPMLQRL